MKFSCSWWARCSTCHTPWQGRWTHGPGGETVWWNTHHRRSPHTYDNGAGEKERIVAVLAFPMSSTACSVPSSFFLSLTLPLLFPSFPPSLPSSLSLPHSPSLSPSPTHSFPLRFEAVSLLKLSTFSQKLLESGNPYHQTYIQSEPLNTGYTTYKRSIAEGKRSSRV